MSADNDQLAVSHQACMQGSTESLVPTIWTYGACRDLAFRACAAASAAPSQLTSCLSDKDDTDADDAPTPASAHAATAGRPEITPPTRLLSELQREREFDQQTAAATTGRVAPAAGRSGGEERVPPLCPEMALGSGCAYGFAQEGLTSTSPAATPPPPFRLEWTPGTVRCGQHHNFGQIRRFLLGGTDADVIQLQDVLLSGGLLAQRLQAVWVRDVLVWRSPAGVRPAGGEEPAASVEPEGDDEPGAGVQPAGGEEPAAGTLAQASVQPGGGEETAAAAVAPSDSEEPAAGVEPTGVEPVARAEGGYVPSSGMRVAVI